MAATEIKKLRMTRQAAADLKRLARELKKTESDVLREGIELITLRERRRRNVEKLIAMAEGQSEPPRPRGRNPRGQVAALARRP